MHLTTRFALHLTVLGATLVTAAIAPARAATPTPTHPPGAAAAALTVPQHAAAPAPGHKAARRPRHSHRSHRSHQPRRGTTFARPRRPAVRPAPHPLPHHRRHVVQRPIAHDPAGPTAWTSLDEAISRIPGYHPGRARWIVSDRYGTWGTADWYHDTLYVSPSVPDSYVYDVAVHEWSHELSVLDYNGDVSSAVDAMNRYFSGTGLVGAERAADCMAILQGATWTHYTSCENQHWRSGARRLLDGQQL